MGEREALSAAEAAGRGVRGGGCVRLVRDEARGHVIGGSPRARMRAGGGHRPREGMRRRLRAYAYVNMNEVVAARQRAIATHLKEAKGDRSALDIMYQPGS